ncbi:MAG: DegT/DnrJ/EryC1/StrS family aminotransferase [Candidatus Dojkabacteria bacterium]|nr:DegT/DnrJ/EryC1/StrS family aminotransferase [Candidatus Dojkabacteria bacterium]
MAKTAGKEKAIFIASSPNTQRDDRLIALKTLISPWRWRSGGNTSELVHLRNEFARMHHTRDTFPFDSGRSALHAILTAAGIGHGDEVVTQAYTCLAVAVGILRAGAVPRYVDIAPGTFNLDPTQVREAIGDKTRAVIVQHTFGEIAPIDQIARIVEEANHHRPHNRRVILIEDCAHSLGGMYNGNPVGAWGTAAFFSFGQEKVISCTRGGLALSRDPEISRNLGNIYAQAEHPSSLSIFRALLHPLLWSVINATYYFPSGTSRFTIGRGILLLARLIGLTRHQADPSHSVKKHLHDSTRKLSNAQARLLLNQIKKLPVFRQHRMEIAEVYNRMLPRRYHVKTTNHEFLRFPILASTIQQRDDLTAVLKQNRVIAGNWYRTPVHPAPDTPQYGYKPGSCPQAEDACTKSINLPTGIHVTTDDARRIAAFFRAG